ncbi:MAG: hypothetical protein LBQ66_03460 [Planctomycetaceae bacterium]|nr:hypothetical protein [Planctomycetaceae bacterium]
MTFKFIDQIYQLTAQNTQAELRDIITAKIFFNTTPNPPRITNIIRKRIYRKVMKGKGRGVNARMYKVS